MKLLQFFIICLSIIINVYSEDAKLFIPQQKLPKLMVEDNFLNVALDTSVIALHFEHFNMSNEKLINLVKKLELGYLRIGGNMADRLYFVNNISFPETVNKIPYNFSCIYDELENCKYADFPNFTMSAKEWTKLNNFAKKVGTKIIFDLNCLIRNDDGSWNSKNAEELISFSAERKFEIDWQLGNEPNAFKHVFHYAVNATQLAKDFTKLRNILNKFDIYKHSLIIGPDVTRPEPKHQESIKYLTEFLQGIKGKNILNVVAFHQYYLNGRTATLDDFLNPNTFDLLDNQIKTVNKIVKNSNQKNLPVWLTETSTAYGGGAKDLSNTFAGTFLWLDKLGLSAKNGIKNVIRQSLFQDYYALIDYNYEPTPDWWLSVFYKIVVGSKVLEYQFSGPATLRLYCHCSSHRKYELTVFGVNISNSTEKITITKPKDLISYAFFFTSDSTLYSKNILINNRKMNLRQNGDLPDILPFIIQENELMVPPYSLFFWIIPYDIEACDSPSVTFF